MKEELLIQSKKRPQSDQMVHWRKISTTSKDGEMLKMRTQLQKLNVLEQPEEYENHEDIIWKIDEIE